MTDRRELVGYPLDRVRSEYQPEGRVRRLNCLYNRTRRLAWVARLLSVALRDGLDSAARRIRIVRDRRLRDPHRVVQEIGAKIARLDNEDTDTKRSQLLRQCFR